MKSSAIIVTLLLLLVGSACTGAPLFRDDFDADVVGEPPRTSPPSDPANDSIRLLDDATVVVTDPAFSGKSLRIGNTNSPAGFREVQFTSAPLTRDRQRYWASWTGRFDDPSNNTPLTFFFGNREIGKAEFRLNQGQVWLVDPSAPADLSRDVRVGPLPGGVHAIIVMIDDASGTYTLSLFPDGPRIETAPSPLVDRSFLGLTDDTLLVDIWFDVPLVGTDSRDAAYLIDDVGIFEHEPDAP